MAYQKITEQEFDDAYSLHEQWLNGLLGKRILYKSCQFDYIDFSKKQLSTAIFKDCKFTNCNFEQVIADGCDFSSSNFVCCNMKGAYFISSCLTNTYFYYADLSYADFSYADISGSNITKCNLIETKDTHIIRNTYTKGFLPICPEEGSFIGFKKAQKYILKLLIPEDAHRSSGFSRKCRCSKAKVLEIQNQDGKIAEITEVKSDYDENFIYKLNEEVSVEDFNPNNWEDCAQGIHFYITREEALYA